MTRISNSQNYCDYLTYNNVNFTEILFGRTSGHAAQLRADHAYNGSYDMDDDIYACEPLYLESEVA